MPNLKNTSVITSSTTPDKRNYFSKLASSTTKLLSCKKAAYCGTSTISILADPSLHIHPYILSINHSHLSLPILPTRRRKSCRATAWPSHKSSCRAANYILRLSLCPREITNPSVFRSFSCPSTVKFAQLRHAIQVAFGWANTHLRFQNLRPKHREAGRGKL
jgi:hypothetical protein